jgi:hypothetical protein
MAVWLRATFFAKVDPRIAAAVTWLTSTVILLYPTLDKLLPLGKANNNAAGDYDSANKAYQLTLATYNGLLQQIDDTQKHLDDLACVMTGSLGFNQQLTDFQQSINASTASPLALLHNVWKIDFAVDTESSEQSSKLMGYITSDWVYGPYFSCSAWVCPNGQTCCYAYGFHTEVTIHSYTQITRITNYYQNVIQGIPFSLSPLNCGAYSRSFSVAAPTTNQVYESTPVNSGDRSAGTTYVDFFRDWSSSISASYSLDGNTVFFNTAVLRLAPQTPATQNDAAADLATHLFQFLATALAAIQMGGNNYLGLQGGFQNQLLTLETNVTAVNTRLQAQAAVLATDKSIYDSTSRLLQNGLGLWVTMILLVPGGLALLAYLLMKLQQAEPEGRVANMNATAVIEDLRGQDHLATIPDTVIQMSGTDTQAADERPEGQPEARMTIMLDEPTEERGETRLTLMP